jgi:serine/threonine protein kinase
MDIRIGDTLPGPAGQDISIESVLGQGGFGQVFAGRLADGTMVAVKTVLTAGLSPDELKVLQNEAHLATKITHPNVVRVLHVDDGTSKGGHPPYIVMEYISGGTLGDSLDAHVKAGSKFSAAELRALYTQVAEGMRAVNAHLVHRDLKPDNVLVDAATGQLKVADFGLAKLVAEATRSETFKGWGTRAYQAPEAFDGTANTPAMDVYAGGVTFYQLAAQTLPVQPAPGAAGVIGWRNAHLLTAPTDLRKLRPDLPLDLVQLVLQMLQKNAAKRPSWDDVVARLQAPAPAPGAPDVTALVHKATSSFQRTMEVEAAARATRERETERKALIHQAFEEPIEQLREVIDAYNGASGVAPLTLQVHDLMSVEVGSASGQVRLRLSALAAGDIDIRPDGIVRITAVAELDPMPKANRREDAFDQNSFGSFNLIYRVQRADDRYGDWLQLRFKRSPLSGQMTYPHWFAMDFHDLPRELGHLRGTHIYEHQQRPLDHEWFKELLAQLL